MRTVLISALLSGSVFFALGQKAVPFSVNIDGTDYECRVVTRTGTQLVAEGPWETGNCKTKIIAARLFVSIRGRDDQAAIVEIRVKPTETSIICLN